MIKSIIDFLARPFTAWVEGRESRKYMKEEGHLIIKKAEVAFKAAKFEAEAKRLQVRDASDVDYDMAAQAERRHTLADEILILCTIVLVGCHFFIPGAMAAGWAAMGYAAGAPWWLEFVIVGIYISVFGLMRLFRAWRPFGSSKVTPKKEETNG